jgi:hypothetical protein
MIIKIIKIGNDCVALFTNYDEFIGYIGLEETYLDNDVTVYYLLSESKLISEYQDKIKRGMIKDKITFSKVNQWT